MKKEKKAVVNPKTDRDVYERDILNEQNDVDATRITMKTKRVETKIVINHNLLYLGNVNKIFYFKIAYRMVRKRFIFNNMTENKSCIISS